MAKKAKKKSKKKVSKKVKKKVVRKTASVLSLAKSKSLKQLISIRERAGKAILAKARLGMVKQREGIAAGLFAGPRPRTAADRKREKLLEAARRESADYAKRMDMAEAVSDY
jgi:hypothetical protein